MAAEVENYQRRTTLLVILSSVSTAVALFATFRLTAALVSADWIGIWSLVQGLFLVARLSDSGAGNNISRVIAVRLKANEDLDMRNFALASLSIACGPSVILAVLSLPFIGYYIEQNFGSSLPATTLWCLVWLGLINALITAFATVLFSICEGCFLLNYKSGAIIVSNIAGVLAVGPLLHGLGAAGIGSAYIVISSVQLILAAVRVRMLKAGAAKTSYSRVAIHIKTLWRENLHLTGIAFIRLSFEPATKFLLSLFAPLTLIAQFELALRVTTQFRVVIQSALQPLLVLGARSGEATDTQLRHRFLSNDRVLFGISIGALTAQALAAPAIEWLGLGTVTQIFIVFFSLLAAGNAINTMGLAGYYWQLSSGSLVPLVRVQVVMACVNIALGTLGRALEAEILVVSAYALAFVYGGLVTRSYLGEISRSRRIFDPLLVVAVGGVASGIVFAIEPRSTVNLVAASICASAVGTTTLYALYRKIRRTAG